MDNEQKYTLQILNELLEEVFDIEFEAEAILIAKGLRYRTPTTDEGQLDGLNRDL